MCMEPPPTPQFAWGVQMPHNVPKVYACGPSTVFFVSGA